MAQGFFERQKIQVRIDYFMRSGKPHPINEAGMVQGVGENDVTFAGQ